MLDYLSRYMGIGKDGVMIIEIKRGLTFRSKFLTDFENNNLIRSESDIEIISGLTFCSK